LIIAKILLTQKDERAWNGLICQGIVLGSWLVSYLGSQLVSWLIITHRTRLMLLIPCMFLHSIHQATNTLSKTQ